MSSIPKQVSDSGVMEATLPPARRMTEEEFVDWCDSETWAEWVDGEVVALPTVEIDHARISTFLLCLLMGFVEDRDLGSVHAARFQVRLGDQRSRRSPDIFFVSSRRRKLLKKYHMDGAPDLIIEIVSPESQARDWREKYAEYEAAGVRECWIIDPMSQRIEISGLSAKRRYVRFEEKDGRISSKVLKGLYIRPAWLWQERPPKVAAILREFGLTR